MKKTTQFVLTVTETGGTHWILPPEDIREIILRLTRGTISAVTTGPVPLVELCVGTSISPETPSDYSELEHLV